METISKLRLAWTITGVAAFCATAVLIFQAFGMSIGISFAMLLLPVAVAGLAVFWWLSDKKHMNRALFVTLFVALVLIAAAYICWLVCLLVLLMSLQPRVSASTWICLIFTVAWLALLCVIFKYGSYVKNNSEVNLNEVPANL